MDDEVCVSEVEFTRQARSQFSRRRNISLAADRKLCSISKTLMHAAGNSSTHPAQRYGLSRRGKGNTPARISFGLRSRSFRGGRAARPTIPGRAFDVFARNPASRTCTNHTRKLNSEFGCESASYRTHRPATLSQRGC